MPILNIKVTNPEAIELIRKIKSGEILIPVKTFLKKYQWYIIIGLIALVLIIALAIGKNLSEQKPAPVFLPPDIDSPVTTPTTTIKSDFSDLKERIQNQNIDLPDPFIPAFDNAINLEETVL